MNKYTIVSPSNQVQSTLPDFVSESYKEFVKFMTYADQSEERIGFSQDLLQNLQRYRDFDTYKTNITEFGVLAENISADDDELTLESGFGFPEENGIIFIDDEVILYREKVGNIFTGLQRGASGTVVLPTFTRKGTYLDTVPAAHSIKSPVKNLSVLFLVSFLETIYKSYSPGINSDRVSPEIDSITFLENIRDFFQSKGSKLGIKALFKLLFAENDVDVNYPGDRMIIPSKSTWSESLIMRTVPIPENLVDPYANYVLPTKVQNSSVFLRSYNDPEILATSICEYVSSYPYEGTVQYEMYLNKDKNSGEFIANPVTELTRELKQTGQQVESNIDIRTITVESTLGFPNSGLLFVNGEGIEYESKSLNQFFECKRGAIGVEKPHDVGSKVYGPYYIEAKTKIDGIEYTSFSWPLGLVQDVEVVDGGLLHLETDDVFINGPGRINPRVPALASFVENYDEQLTSQGQFPPELTFVQNYTAGVSGIYFDSSYVFVASSGFPYYPIGPFSDNGTIGSSLKPNDTIYIIPRELRENTFITSKGTDEIGVAVDGVPIYSEVSPIDLVQGEIKDFNVISRGRGYQNPTVVIDPPFSSAEANITNGQVVSIIQTTTSDYADTPSVRITSGEGASFNLTFDNFGRITNVTIDNPGEYYNDVPSLSVVDSSGRGTGALVSCTVDDGSIATVSVELTGIDYNPLTTQIVTTPIGEGAVVEAVVENYKFNRYQLVLNEPNWSFDSGNGFLWPAQAGSGSLASTYGYICNPSQLRSQLDDDGTKHSPILGWAFDGNPIYGPYGYTNGKNDSGGVELQESGYVLRANRVGLGSSPPAVGAFNANTNTYPMGSFVEDYEYQPPVVSNILLTTDDGLTIMTNQGYDISTDSSRVAENVLDPNNGRICNTPEYPEELYPDGVYAYFVTIDSGQVPQFPYMLGTTFTNRPISQALNVTSEDRDPDALRSAAYSPSSYDDTELTFNFTRVERYRNPYLTPSKQDVDIDISDTTTGSISSIIVENGLPDNTKIGDILYYDNTGLDGTGAEGRVSYVTGEDIAYSGGSLVQTYLKSHRQAIDLSAYKGKESFIFVRDTFILCTSGAISQVKKWDTNSYVLTVQTITKNLVQYGDGFYDNREAFVRAPVKEEDEPFFKLAIREGISLSATRPNHVTMSYRTPSLRIGGADPEPGDIWWSIFNGRLYVFYDDGDTQQWVEAQPMGTQPINDTASDVGVGTTTPAGQSVINPGTGNTVTISTNAPDTRADGSANRLGDLWWSNQTGMLYIWYSDVLADFQATGQLPSTNIAQWVMTDPTGTVPGVGASDKLYPELPSASVFRGNIYTSSLTCIISDVAPTEQTDGSSLEFGNLWWCTLNGKMYIYWNDGDTVQWTQSTPVGNVSTIYGSSDEPLNPTPGPGPGPGPFPPDPDDDGNDIGVIPETAEQKLLWFRDTTNFLPGDIVNFQKGAPGASELTEISLLEDKGTPENANGIFIRGYGDTALTLPNNTLMVNDSRALYVVNTVNPTKLNVGDIVLFENSSFDEVNGEHVVQQAGHVVPGLVEATISDLGRVNSLTIVDPGAYYSEGFYIGFTGGGGQGALGYAEVAPLVQGGGIISVGLIEGGSKYTSPPTAILGTELTNTQFQIYVDNLYPDDNPNVKYSAFGEAVESTAAYIDVNSGGIGYAKIPPALGLYKNEADRADLLINDGSANPEGSAIESVSVVRGGARYVNPTAIFGDRLNSGEGAKAEVTVANGVVTEITITDGGSGYIEPYVTLVEESGKYISLTKDIGKITALSVINPGRDISVDRSLKPELQITTRCIIRYIDQIRGPFVPGSTVYQGTSDVRLVTAIVVDYDDKIQQLTLAQVNGELRPDEIIKDEFGTTAMVILEGEADCRCVVNGTSEPEGTFINDTSMVSERYAVIQDSKKYQWFSYEIESVIPRVDYENFVNDIIHPAGFIMFSTMELNDSVQTDLDVLDVEFAGREGYVPPVVEPLALTVSVYPTEPNIGTTLTALTTLTGGTEPYTYTYEWIRDLGVIVSGNVIPGATESTYVIPSGYEGWTFSCSVTVTDEDGNAITVKSAETSPVDATSPLS